MSDDYPSDLVNFFNTKQRNNSSESNSANAEKASSGNGNNGSSDDNKKEILGTIKFVHYEKEYGFISPDLCRKEKGVKEEGVYFRFDRVRSYMFRLKKNDKVIFRTYLSREKKLSAINVILVEPVRRSIEEISDYLDLLYTEITSAREDNSITTSVAQIIGGADIWKHITHMVWVTYRSKQELLFKFLTTIINLELVGESFRGNFKKILVAITDVPQFLNPFSGYLKEVIEKIEDGEYVRLLQQFLLLIVRYLPSKLQAVISLSKPFVKKNNLETTTDFLFRMLQAVAKLSSANVGDMEWKNLPLIITNEEIHSSVIFEDLCLRQVKAEGAYESPDEYMETYFRLLRTDCFSNLKKGITDCLNGKLDPRDMNLYVNVVLYGIEIVKDHFYLALKLKPLRKIKSWERCSNLMFGNLLCISIGHNFENIIWATVVDRRLLQSDSIVMVQTCSEFNYNNDAEILNDLLTTSAHVVMAESPTYYRAYQPIFKSLQSLDAGDMSFLNELVFLKENDPFFELDGCFDSEIVYKQKSGKISVGDFVEKSYDPNNSIFDESQEKAIKIALQSNIGIIQGPPGTGKSFIGVQLLRLFLSMPYMASRKILILTYKNHALDEFVKSAMRYFPKDIVRIGGRSRDPELESISLKNVRLSEKKNFDFNDIINSLEAEMRKLKIDIDELFEKLSARKHFTYIEVYDEFSAEQKINLIRYCDWSKSKLTSFSIGNGNEDGFSKQTGKKRNKNRITASEVDHILKNINQHQDKVMILLHAAFVQWLPKKEEFFTVEAKLKGRGNKSKNLDFIAKEFKSSEKFNEDVDDEDDIEIIEKQQERHAECALGPQAGRMITKVRQQDDKNKESIHSFSLEAMKQLASGNSGIILNYENIWKLETSQRVLLVECIIDKSIKTIMDEFKEKVIHFDDKRSELDEFNNQKNSLLLKTKSIIAMTITGASINNMLLKAIQPEVVIVEEAAEILEPQLLAAIGSWTKYMLLIGDQYQLRPSVETYELKRDFKFDISMMERLINNKMKYSTLGLQNRQRPEFAELLRDIYPDLKTNLDRVSGNEPARCLAKSFFFWDHDFEETAGRSLSNQKEAERAVMLALFLILQGYQASTISIISTYLGQTSLIRKVLDTRIKEYGDKVVTKTGKSLRSFNEGEGVIVHTVDMYQGDENDFVIVSLVRSNAKKKIGFLSERNRRCVAQSRAKCGVYFIGNADMFLNHRTWSPMMDSLKLGNRIDKLLALKCEYHPSAVIQVATLTLDNFCDNPCTFSMKCGIHPCRRKCQPGHSHEKCEEVITSTRPGCRHQCQRKCCEGLDPRCLSEVHFTFPECKHEGIKKCYENISNIICSYLVEVKMKCGHLRKKSCFENIDDLKCKEKCTSLMSCGIHLCSRNCQPLHSHDSCENAVSFTHTICGHKDQRKCKEDPCDKKCLTKVTFYFPDCRHEGEKSCYEKIAALKCSFKENVQLACGHYKNKRCYENINDKQCEEKCKRERACGHPCDHKCYEHALVKQCLVCDKINDLKAEKQRKEEEAHRKNMYDQIADEIKKLRDTSVVKGEVDKVELTPDGPAASEYFDVEDLVRKYVQPTHSWFPIVKSIYKVTNNYLKIKWLEARKLMFDPGFRSALKFHGTSEESMDEIVKHGFRLPHSGGNHMYGPGIYFASDSSKSAQKIYTKGSNKLLLCDVLIGKSHTVDKECKDMSKGILMEKNSDSLFAKRGTRETGGVLYDEFVIFNPYQAYPKYIIHYEEGKCIKDPSTTLNFGGHTFATGRQLLLPKRGMKLDDIKDNHFRTAESQFLRLLGNMGQVGKFSVEKVEFYMDETLRKNFEKKVTNFESKYGRNDSKSEILFGFHGTKDRNIVERIMNNNFRKSASGKFGAGVYFSEIPTYTFGYGGTNHLILAKILPGNVYPCSSSGMGSSGLRVGFDSHGGIPVNDGSGRYNEIVIFDTNQILPCYVIHIK